jgi:L-fuconate dehydratase
MSTFTRFEVRDVRFPTSATLDGSDAMNPDPDYSAAYLTLGTDAGDGLEGTGFVFTIGRGNDVEVQAIEALAGYVLGKDCEAALSGILDFSRSMLEDSQLRWLGPEKGVMHMAIGAVVNALWDLRSKREGVPLWRLIAELETESLLREIDFRYLEDVLGIEDARGILDTGLEGREQRIEQLERNGFPAYTTSPGWLGYSDELLERRCREAMAAGFRQIKLKVGADVEDDRRRLAIARKVCGPDFPIAIDANQRWGVAEAIEWIGALAEFSPSWVEEPTSPDDILGLATIARGVAPIRVVTGEHVQNRIIFKQLLQQRATAVVQLDATRVAGVNENLAILLLAKKFDVPVCPHAGGVGLSEIVRHLSFADYARIGTSLDGRMIEWADHLHEHFVEPATIAHGSYDAPQSPGMSATMLADSLDAYQFPLGSQWQPAYLQEITHL